MDYRKMRLAILLNIFLIYFAESVVINNNVERIIDLSSQLVKITYNINAKETNGNPIKEYVFIPPTQNVSFISVKAASKKKILIRNEVINDRKQMVLSFSNPSSIEEFNVETVITKALEPHPAEISQNEKQFVKYTGSLYFQTPYETKTQRTSIILSSPNIVSYTQVKPFSVNSNKINYGPYQDIKEFTQKELVIHYENQTPFLTVNLLERTIEVSHWGNIAVKETIQLMHTGAKLKGSFSRYEFQKDGRSGQAAVKSYKSILPASATDVYYRDTNGNISTSNMNILRDAVDIELRPRFPLFGGWKTHYTLGYNVPSYEYLYNDGDKYQLKMRIIDHIHDDMQIEEATVKIILPEGSTNIELKSPYEIKKHENGLFYTYLDTVGRPVVSFSKSNLVENHIQDFVLTYNFSRISLLQEPLLLISFIFIVFMTTILFLRLDFSINNNYQKDNAP